VTDPAAGAGGVVALAIDYSDDELDAIADLFRRPERTPAASRTS
jgi:hypothetical protein